MLIWDWVSSTRRSGRVPADHQLTEQGRRDDLEAVGYVLLYFLRGGLPWQGIKIKDATERYAETGRRKLATCSSSLCSGYPKVRQAVEIL